MTLTRLSDLFEVHNGLASSEVMRSPVPRTGNWIPYIRPSYRQDSSIDAYVNKHLVPSDKIFPAGSLYVSTDGQGSHSYAYVSATEFVPNSNVAVLVPLTDMTLNEKFYYALCITRNRAKFSYGRKPKGDRLKDILLPDIHSLPPEIKRVNFGKIRQDLTSILDLTALGQKAGTTSRVGDMTTLDSLFHVVNGISSAGILRSSTPKNSNWIPYIRPSYRQSTSIDAYVNKYLIPAEKVFPKGSLYVSTNGQGSHTYAYVSASEFVPNSDVSVLIPKREMCLREKLAYSLFITRNRFRFSYGRKPKGEKLKALLLPYSIPAEWNDIDLDSFVTRVVLNPK